MRKWDREDAYIYEIFRRYWEQNDASIADYAGLREVATGLSVDANAFEAEAESDAVRQALIDSTQAGLARGVFGAPSFIVGSELYWGKDRMDFIDAALGGG